MLRLVVLGLVAALAMATPLHQDFSLTGDLLQGNFEIGSAAQNGLFSASSAELMLEKLLSQVKDEASLEKLFGEFKKLYEKSYKSGDHESAAKEHFARRLLLILENNIKAAHGQSSYVLAVRPFSDLPLEEILTSQPAGNWPASPKNVDAGIHGINETDEYANNWVFDYRQQHVVTGIVNQGGCGSCVYFAAAACIESFWARKGHGLVHLSPQQLNDCARDEAHGNHGCQHGGGTFVPTFNYIRSHGLASMSEYPYIARDAACRKDKESHPVAHISSWHPTTPHNDEVALEKAVHDHGPNAVAIHVSDGVAHYKHGIFDGECRGGRNHAVLVVGYGRENERDFWLLKNQWGEGFGDHGYFRLARKHGNICDVAGDAVWVE